ncbi:alpha-amylase [Microbacterium ulmi]|uniref:Alpha-amylase n=1 Tax=Microbacterium ulmi TaxID=179095 RepID=A0A7Y2LZH1_9MICO|nr:alpha-amylase family protein [Microbacterium ulmi]NII68747.1 alpha-amylase [Microbacterium ulmi]NNH03592.1 alpha-amylase [Microbacterium ulmi]
MPRPIRRLALAAAGALAASLALGGCSATIGTVEVGPPDVGVQLFQLPWTTVAQECEQNLGPAGFAWVLVSPAQESVTGDEWWTSYQPVSYRVESRLGTRAEFADMTARCREAGVAVIADAVVNHMTGQDAAGTGWAGSAYDHYSYPGLYAPEDFHHCGLTPNDDIADYGSREQVQTCELVNLADLDTSSPAVRERIGAYLDDLLSLGVAGVRIDAAKHIAAADVAAIVGGLPAGTRILSEVIRGGGEPVQPEEYTSFGEVFEFTYARDLAPQLRAGVLTDPDLSGERPLHVPSDRAVVFVDNHDTERGEAGVTYRDGDLYAMANALMLADDFGTPVVYSGYAFTDRDAGAPVDADGRVVAPVCAAGDAEVSALADGDRTCVHAWTAIRGMLEWRRVAASAPRLPGVDDGDAYGFEREGRAVVAVNPGADEERLAVPTTLPDGRYCDVVRAGPVVADTAPGCADDETVEVAGGSASFALAPGQTSAIHSLARLP